MLYLIQTIIKCNLKHEQIFVSGDKDFADRAVIKEKLPQVQCQLCLYHVIKNFEREVTTVKRGITDIERKRILLILNDMVYASSIDVYNSLYNELVNLNIPSVMLYFDKNWHSIKEEWTMFGRNQFSNYLNTTSNRV